MTRYIPNPALDLVIERTIPVPPERVWAAWTDPALMVQWFTPAPWKTASAEVDLRPGGANCVTMESPEGDRYPNAGCYLVVEPNELLIFTSAMSEDFRPVGPQNGAENMPFTARIEMQPSDDGGTHYRAVAMHADEAGRVRHEEMGFHEGWSAVLDQLVALMS